MSETIPNVIPARKKKSVEELEGSYLAEKRRAEVYEWTLGDMVDHMTDTLTAERVWGFKANEYDDDKDQMVWVDLNFVMGGRAAKLRFTYPQARQLVQELSSLCASVPEDFEG
jgi:hypothetical protein